MPTYNYEYKTNASMGNMFSEKFKESRFYKWSRLITTSATFALFLSVAFFIYEMVEEKHESSTIVNNLLEIQNSITTRYLGIFPEYIDGINRLLEDGVLTFTRYETHRVDTIIIFEDVLYYGAVSRSDEFRKMNELILQLAQSNCAIYIVYYAPHSIPFNETIRESFIAPKYISQYASDIHSFWRNKSLLESEKKMRVHQMQKPSRDSIRLVTKELFYKYYDTLLTTEQIHAIDVYQQQIDKQITPIDRNLLLSLFLDSLKCEQYFRYSVEEDHKKYAKMLEAHLAPIKQSRRIQRTDNIEIQNKVDVLISEMEKCKRDILTHPGMLSKEEISFGQYKHLYLEYTRILENFYKNSGHNVCLIPIQNYHTMSCWMTHKDDGTTKAIFAFPSKYATDEIGFVSQDENISNYIFTMLRGVQTQYFLQVEE